MAFNDRFDPQNLLQNIRPYLFAVAWAPSASVLPYGPCRAIRCGSAGTLDVVTIDGTPIPGLPVDAGMNEMCVSKITASSVGTIWVYW